MKLLVYALWSAAAGALIPVMAVLNARLGRALGAPSHAAMVLFLVAFALAVAVSLLVSGRLPGISTLAAARPIDFAGGLIVGFYVLSITVLAPAFGVGNAILFVMVAQIFTSAAIDHFGLFGAPVRSVSSMRLFGLMVLVAGLAISQLADRNGNP